MKLSARYGLVAIGALATLSVVHWSRDHLAAIGPTARFVIGVLPNLAASIAIPAVILGIRADQNPPLTRDRARVWVWLSLAAAGCGLVVWEFVQLTSRKLVFDVYDLFATAAGLVIAAVTFQVINRR